MTPNTQITPETVGMLKAGDWLRDRIDGSIWQLDFVGSTGLLCLSQGTTMMRTEPDSFIFVSRPAASSPSAVGVGEATRAQWLWAAKIVRELGPSMSPGAMAATMERLAEKAPTPTPVDWERVGPKLVEALELALPSNLCLTNKGIADSVVVSIDATMGDLRQIAAALAAAQPGAK